MCWVWSMTCFTVLYLESKTTNFFLSITFPSTMIKPFYPIRIACCVCKIWWGDLECIVTLLSLFLVKLSENFPHHMQFCIRWVFPWRDWHVVTYEWKTVKDFGIDTALYWLNTYTDSFYPIEKGLPKGLTISRHGKIFLYFSGKKIECTVSF